MLDSSRELIPLAAIALICTHLPHIYSTTYIHTHIPHIRGRGRGRGRRGEREENELVGGGRRKH